MKMKSTQKKFKFSSNIYLILFFAIILLSLNLRAQTICTVAGNGTNTFSGDGGAASISGIPNPNFISTDLAGNIYLFNNNKVRKITSDGTITTIAGDGNHRPPIMGAQATNSGLYGCNAMAVDDLGNIYIADNSNKAYKITNTGLIDSFTGGGGVGEYDFPTLATNADYMGGIGGLSHDHKNNIYVAATWDCIVGQISPMGIISTYAGGENRSHSGWCGFAGDGGAATSAKLNSINIITVDSIGNLYIVDNGNARIRKVRTDGIISTIAGIGIYGYSPDGIPATNARIGNIQGMAVDNSGNVYFTTDNSIRKISNTGYLYTIAGNNSNTGGFDGDGGPATVALLNKPGGLSFDKCGNLYVADRGNHRIRKIAFNPDCGQLEIYEANQTSNLLIYPNPTNQKVNISSSNKIESISITNTLGQVLFQNNYMSYNIQIDVDSLPRGIYFIKINNKIDKKFIKD